MVKSYEVLLILPVKLSEEEQNATVERVLKEIDRAGGAALRQRHLGRRAFARPIRKQDHGVYVELEVDLDATALAPLNGRLRLLENLLRYRIVTKSKIVPTNAAATELAPVAEATE